MTTSSASESIAIQLQNRQKRFENRQIFWSLRPWLIAAFLCIVSLKASGETLKTRSPQDFLKLASMVTQELFWHKKSVWQAMEKDRKVPVSVVHKGDWSFKGAGLVRAPRSFSLERAKDFDRLVKIPKHFRSVSFDAQSSVLHLELLFLGRQRPLELELFEDHPFSNESRVYFRSKGPWLSGLEGVFLFKDHERHGTEVGIVAAYSGDIGWTPNWLFSLAAEAVMHHVAEQLRNTLENDYKSSLEK